MSAYELYLFLHIGGAVAWVGSGFLMVVLGTRAMAASDPERAVAHAHDAEWAGLRVFLPSNLVVLASAFLLVEEGNWGYGALWERLGFIGFAVSFAVGAAYFAPGWARVGKLAAAEGAASEAVRSRLRTLMVVSWADLGILLGVIFCMTVKPVAGQTGALVVAAAIPVVLTASGFLLASRGAAAQSRASTSPRT